jgi:Zn-dependent peptidase ImmA (M78 family)
MRRTEEMAQAQRLRLGLGDRGPIADLLRVLEEQAGLYVGLVQLGLDSVAGIYQVRDDLPIILINSSFPPVRQRFTLAHEYGHHCLQHGLAVDHAIDLGSKDRREIEANQFAAELLLPRLGVEWWLQTHEDPPLTLPTLVRMAAYFGVSCQVALFRLEACGRVKPSVKRSLQASLEAGEHSELARRLRLLQLVDTLVRERHREVRMPGPVARVILRAFDAGLIDQRTAAQRLHLDEQEIKRLRADNDFV